MTRDEVVQLIAWRLGNRKDMGERIISEMRFVQSMVLEQNSWHPWFLEKNWTGGVLEAGATEVALPTDYLAEVENEQLWLITPDNILIRLRKELPSDLPDVISSGYGISAYAVTAAKVLFNASSTQAHGLQWRYIGKADSMA